MSEKAAVFQPDVIDHRSWPRRRLGEICTVVGGSTPESSVPEFWGRDIVWVTPTDLGKLPTMRISDSARRITQAGHNSCRCELVPAGSVVLSSRAPIGHLAIAGRDLCTNQGCKSFVPGPSVDSEFLYFVLKANVRNLRILGSGATFSEVSKTQLENFCIPCPPLVTQRRVAERLIVQLESVKRARVAAEAQLEAATALKELLIEETLKRRGEASNESSIGDFSCVSGGIQKTPNRKPHAFFRPYLTVRNVQRGVLNLTQIEEFEVSLDEMHAYRLNPGDMLIVEGNGSPGQIGRNALFGGEISDCVHQNHLIRVRVDRNRIFPKYLSYYLNSRAGKRLMLGAAKSTTGLHTLSVSKIEALKIPLPSLEQQEYVIREIDEATLNVSGLRCGAEGKLAALASYGPALLTCIFGRANPQSTSGF